MEDSMSRRAWYVSIRAAKQKRRIFFSKKDSALHFPFCMSYAHFWLIAFEFYHISNFQSSFQGVNFNKKLGILNILYALADFFLKNANFYWSRNDSVCE